jgi:hypothetical protein
MLLAYIAASSGDINILKTFRIQKTLSIIIESKHSSSSKRFGTTKPYVFWYPGACSFLPAPCTETELPYPLNYS